MSYVIPNNSKSSIILYLDSRDATSYLATKLETDIDGNSREVNLNSYFQYILTENIECFGDKFMIETILNNLIENALKYAGVEHKITVYATVKKKMICFGVKDLGPGIRKDLRSRIFEKFYRIGSEEIRSQKGSGLGLFIVSELVKMHKGELLCLENIPNGSNFEINIPK